MTKHRIRVDLGHIDATKLDGTLGEAKVVIEELIDKHGADCEFSFSHLDDGWDVFNISTERSETDEEYRRRIEREESYRNDRIRYLRVQAEELGFELKAKE